jgi:L-fucose dehydrogenase
MTPLYERWIETFEDPQAQPLETTRHNPLRSRMTKPEEQANQVVFLLSSRAGDTTGQWGLVNGSYAHRDRALNGVRRLSH